MDELPSIQKRFGGVMGAGSLKPWERGNFEKNSILRKVLFVPISAHLMEVSM
jgi:hypothetical protein